MLSSFSENQIKKTAKKKKRAGNYQAAKTPELIASARERRETGATACLAFLFGWKAHGFFCMVA
jgi:hypothetical protein